MTKNAIQHYKVRKLFANEQHPSGHCLGKISKSEFRGWFWGSFWRKRGQKVRFLHKNAIFLRFFLHSNFFCSIFALAIRKNGCKVLKIAEIAQLVEHNLAKVGVASSSLVFRSTRGLREIWDFFVFVHLRQKTAPHAPVARFCSTKRKEKQKIHKQKTPASQL